MNPQFAKLVNKVNEKSLKNRLVNPDAPEPVVDENKQKVASFQKFLMRKLKFWLQKKRQSAYWQGDCVGWNETLAKCKGYDAPEILENIKQAALQVRDGKAAYERDGQLFYDTEPCWYIFGSLLKIAINAGGTINLIDFGGSLGSTYFQNRPFLSDLKNIQWNIVEQKHFVDFGKQNLENNELHFFEDLRTAKEKSGADTILLSGVLSYIENPYLLIREIIRLNFKYVIVDRTPLTKKYDDILTIQYVKNKQFRSSYPTWVFSYYSFKHAWEGKYKILTQCNSVDSIFTDLFLYDGEGLTFSNFRMLFMERV